MVGVGGDFLVRKNEAVVGGSVGKFLSFASWLRRRASSSSGLALGGSFGLKLAELFEAWSRTTVAAVLAVWISGCRRYRGRRLSRIKWGREGRAGCVVDLTVRKGGRLMRMAGNRQAPVLRNCE